MQQDTYMTEEQAYTSLRDVEHLSPADSRQVMKDFRELGKIRPGSEAQKHIYHYIHIEEEDGNYRIFREARCRLCTRGQGYDHMECEPPCICGFCIAQGRQPARGSE